MFHIYLMLYVTRHDISKMMLSFVFARLNLLMESFGQVRVMEDVV